MSDPASPFYSRMSASGGTGDISLGATLPGHVDLKLAAEHNSGPPACCRR